MLYRMRRCHPRLLRSLAALGLALVVLWVTAAHAARAADDVFLPMVSDLSTVTTPTPTVTPSPTVTSSPTVTPSPTVTSTPTPEGASGAFFVDDDWKTSSASIEAGSDGSLHLGFYYYEPANHESRSAAVYAVCPGPADQCGDPNSDNWQGVRLLEDAREVQLGLTPDNKPRLLIKTTSTHQAGGMDYYYVECNAKCTDAKSWTGALVVTTYGTAVFDAWDDGLPQHSFALDSQGRPRFIYIDYNYPIEPDHVGSFYSFCNSECTDPANWSDVLIGELIEAPFGWDVMLHPSLTFTKAGQPRIVSELITIEDDQGGIYYFECNGGCNQHANWQRAKIAERGQGPELSRDLALDPANRPRVAIYPAFLDGDAGEQLYYMWCNGDCLQPGNWQSINLGLGSENGRGPDLELDAQGRPRIAYADHTDGGLGYAWCNANCESPTQWQHQVVESAADLYTAWPVAYPLTCDGGLWDGLTPSLSLDTAGDPRIAYDTTYHARCLYDEDETDNNPPDFAFHLIQRAVRVNFFPQP